MTGSCPDVRFKLNGRTVDVDNRTKFKGGACRSLRNGTDVTVKGVLLSDGTVRAEQIEFDD